MLKFYQCCFLLSILSLTACIYKPTVQQGNILSVETVRSVHKGMSEKVLFQTLGNPVLITPFANKEEKIYIYTITTQNSTQQKQFTVTLKNGKVWDFSALQHTY